MEDHRLEYNAVAIIRMDNLVQLEMSVLMGVQSLGTNN